LFVKVIFTFINKILFVLDYEVSDEKPIKEVIDKLAAKKKDYRGRSSKRKKKDHDDTEKGNST